MKQYSTPPHYKVFASILENYHVTKLKYDINKPEVISVPLFKASIRAALASSSEGPEEGGGASKAGGGGGGGGPGGGGAGAPPAEPLISPASPPCKTEINYIKKL